MVSLCWFGLRFLLTGTLHTTPARQRDRSPTVYTSQRAPFLLEPRDGIMREVEGAFSSFLDPCSVPVENNPGNLEHPMIGQMRLPGSFFKCNRRTYARRFRAQVHGLSVRAVHTNDPGPPGNRIAIVTEDSALNFSEW